MSTPDQPDSPQLTRRQLREIRNTASTPIITPEVLADAAAAAEEDAVVTPPLARAAEPTVVSEAPPPAEDVDLDTPALTRRGARQQERIRTASVPVIAEGDPAPATPDAEAPAPSDDASSPTDDEGIPARETEAHADEADGEAPTETETETVADGAPEADDEPRPVIAPTLGSGLLSGQGVEVELPASFDQLLTRGSTATGALVAPNALILSQTPDTGSFTSPVAATGEILVTGTFNLPDRFGSTGTVPGTADGKDVDAVLIDGELPASSSPTPIAASAAISTIKSAEDIIKPPAPEKGGRLMLALVITAGALALALTGVLIVALVTGAFS